MTSDPLAGRRSPRLRRRIVVTVAGGTLLATTVLVFVVQLVLAHTVANQVALTLQARADAVLGTLELRQGALVALETPAPSLDQGVWIFDAGGNLVEGKLPTGVLGRTITGLTDVASVRGVDVDASTRLLAVPARIPGDGPRVGTVVLSLYLSAYERSESNALFVSISVGLVTVLSSAGIAWWTVGRSLRPVEQMARQARDWSEHDLDRRFDLGPTDHEIATLATTLDGLLGRVANALRGEQRLSQEMAHELRTPLTAVRAEAERALQHADGHDRERWQRVVQTVDAMATTVTTLLAVARNHASTATSTTLGSVVTSAMAHLDESGFVEAFDGTSADVLVTAPLELAARSLVPLLENARHHASGTVRLDVQLTDRVVELSVLDDGPGIGVEDPEELFEPGRRREGSAGAGLGLALARRVARGFGGDVRLLSCDAGGHAVLVLPRR